MKSYWRGISSLVLVLALALVAACAPRAETVAGVTGIVVLPSLERCLYVGDGATLSFDGQRLDWTCESPVGLPRGLLGAPEIGFAADVRWRLVATERPAVGGGFVIGREEIIEARAEALVLETGETCRFAGEGATLAFELGRVNFTCGEEVVVVGDLRADARGLLAVRGTLVRADDDDSFTLVDAQPVRVTTVTLE